MLRYVHNQDIDLRRWDECIKNASNQHVYAFSWYLNTVSPGWDAIIKEINDIYVAVMPIPRTKKWGVPMVKQPVLCQQLGVFYKESLTVNEWRELFMLLDKSCPYISSYHFNEDNTVSMPEVPDSFSVFKKYNFLLFLNKEYTVLQSLFSTNRTTKRGVIDFYIEESTNPTKLIELFKTYTEQKIYGGVRRIELERLKKLFYYTHHHKLSKLYHAVYKNRVIAASLFLHSTQRIYFLFSSSDEVGRKSNAIASLIDAYIKSYSTQHIMLDFKGSDQPSIASFYASFGAEPATYICISKNNWPPILKKIRRWRKFFIQFIRRMPSPPLLFHL